MAEPVSAEGVKYDAGKPRLDLIPPEATLAMGDVFTYGAAKYADRNWELGMDHGRLIAAAKRHLTAFEAGQDIDPESNLRHLAHALSTTAMLLALNERGVGADTRSPFLVARERAKGILSSVINRPAPTPVFADAPLVTEAVPSTVTFPADTNPAGSADVPVVVPAPVVVELAPAPEVTVEVAPAIVVEQAPVIEVAPAIVVEQAPVIEVAPAVVEAPAPTVIEVAPAIVVEAAPAIVVEQAPAVVVEQAPVIEVAPVTVEVAPVAVDLPVAVEAPEAPRSEPALAPVEEAPVAAAPVIVMTPAQSLPTLADGTIVLQHPVTGEQVLLQPVTQDIPLTAPSVSDAIPTIEAIVPRSVAAEAPVEPVVAAPVIVQAAQ